METKKRVFELVAKKSLVPENEIKAESTWADLGMDSLDLVEIIMDFESEFKVSIPDEDMEKLQTIGDAIKYLEINDKI